MKISGPVIFPPAVAGVTDDGCIRRTAHPPRIGEPQSGQRLCLTFIRQNDAFEPDAAPIKLPVAALRTDGTFRWPPVFAHPFARGFGQRKVRPADQHVVVV